MKYLKLFSIITFSVFFYASCKTVPVTGRKQLNLVPNSILTALSFATYDSVVKTGLVLPSNDERTKMVTRVGKRIQEAVEMYFKANDMEKQINGFQWEYNVMQAEMVNAWCMPGGKVMVYTGLLPVAMNEEGLAVVMGHEIAHAVAKHGNERMSEGLLLGLGGLVLDEALKTKSEETRAIFLGLYNIGTTLALQLPNSRMQESEADKLGLIFMSMAGYNPEAAIAFWQRMAEQNKGNVLPQFLSTHPSDKKRLQHLSSIIPGIKQQYYKEVQ